LLQTLRAPPERGSLRESVLILLLVKQETIEHARFRALAQITVDKEKGIEAFEEYMKIAFPYLAASKKKERGEHIKYLQQEVSRGALAVRAVSQPTLKSRVAAAKNRTQPQSPAEEKRIYRRIGRAI
jgi:hypothetical protein